MNRRCILVIVPPDPDAAPEIADAFRKNAPSLLTDMAAPDDAPLGTLQEGRYKAVVCWADTPEDLAVVERIRRAGPATPILLVSSVEDEKFRQRAMAAGASSLLPGAAGAATLAGLIEHAVVQGPRRSALAPLPLLVSDEAAEAAKLAQAFDRAGMFAPLPVLRSSEEAIAYLSGTAPFTNRERHPLPSLILLDFHGPRGGGLDLLGWIRQQEKLRHLPVIMLSATVDREDIQNAYGLQANSYLIKPGNDVELFEMVKAIKLYWSSLNISPGT